MSTTPPKPLPIRPRFSKELESSFLGKAELAPTAPVTSEATEAVSPAPATSAGTEALAPAATPPAAIPAAAPLRTRGRRTTGPRGGTSTILASGQINLHIYVDEAEHEAIRKAAFDQEISKSDLVRAAVRAYFGLPARKP